MRQRSLGAAPASEPAPAPGRQEPHGWGFDTFRLDLRDERLWRGPDVLPLHPKTFAVLCCLVTQAGQLVTKDTLLEAVWPETAVSEAVLQVAIRELRRVLGDQARAPRFIATVHGRGYRFIAPVAEPSAAPPPRATPTRSEVPMAGAPPSPGHVAFVARGPEALGATFQDVLAGDQTVVTVVCGALDPVDALTVGVWGEVGAQLRQTFFTLAQEEGQRYAGTLTFFGADAIVMLFAQEAHAQRAVWAALALQHRVQDQALARTGTRVGHRLEWQEVG